MGRTVAGSSALGSAEDAGSAPVDVRVVASGTTGPFDYQVIQVDAGASNPAALAIDWLDSNGYDVTALGEQILGEYLGNGLNLVAFKLNKNADSGSIRPVVLTYAAERAMIPIRPTALAANDDMGILVWVLGRERAAPTNYLSLEINEALIDWFNPSDSYDQVVTAAADEAGGQGFVTERASPATAYDNAIWRSWEHHSFEDLEQLTEPEQLEALLTESTWTFGDLDGFTDLVRQTVLLRDDVTPKEFISCAACYFERGAGISEGHMDGFDAGVGPSNLAGNLVEAGVGEDGSNVAATDGGSPDPIFGTDRDEFLTQLDELVIAPMRLTQQLFDSTDYVTRLYTTMSPDEMTIDPEFDFNPDLGDIDSLHQRDQVMHCSDGGTGWTVDFADNEVRGTGRQWPIKVGDQPANWRILQLSKSGTGTVITNHREDSLAEQPSLQNDDSSSEAGAEASSNASSNTAGTADNDGARSTSSGCSVARGGSALAASGLSGWWLIFLGLGAVFRRLALSVGPGRTSRRLAPQANEIQPVQDTYRAGSARNRGPDCAAQSAALRAVEGPPARRHRSEPTRRRR